MHYINGIEYENKGQIAKGCRIENLCNASLDCLCENMIKLNIVRASTVVFHITIFQKNGVILKRTYLGHIKTSIQFIEKNVTSQRFDMNGNRWTQLERRTLTSATKPTSLPSPPPSSTDLQHANITTKGEMAIKHHPHPFRSSESATPSRGETFSFTPNHHGVCIQRQP